MRNIYTPNVRAGSPYRELEGQARIENEII